jgi:hypothetical protein
VKALWIYIVTCEFGIPTVYKPDVVIRDLRKLFSQYQLLYRQIRVLKNNIQAIVVDNGIKLTKDEKNALLLPKYGKDILKRLELLRPAFSCLNRFHRNWSYSSLVVKSRLPFNNSD